MKQLICIICLCFPITLFAINEDEISLTRERTFVGTGLYGFMNGGADLFLEYGVQKLVTRDFVYQEEEYTLDIYEMPTPEDAFGIYSMHVFKCTQTDVGNEINCLSPYQLQAVIGNCYITLVFASNSERARMNANGLIRHYTAGIEKKYISLPEELPANLSFSGVLKFLRGPISLSNAQFSLTTLLKDVSFDGIWLFPSEKEGESQAFIFFDTADTMIAVREKVSPSDRISSDSTWLYLRCRKAEKPANDYGPFGF